MTKPPCFALSLYDAETGAAMSIGEVTQKGGVWWLHVWPRGSDLAINVPVPPSVIGNMLRSRAQTLRLKAEAVAKGMRERQAKERAERAKEEAARSKDDELANGRT